MTIIFKVQSQPITMSYNKINITFQIQRADFQKGNNYNSVIQKANINPCEKSHPLKLAGNFQKFN